MKVTLGSVYETYTGHDFFGLRSPMAGERMTGQIDSDGRETQIYHCVRKDGERKTGPRAG